MAGNKNADSTNISRKYLDSLVIESRILGAEHPNAALVILGCHFETPVMGAALSHLKGGMAGYAEGFKDAGALVSVGMGSAEELKEILSNVTELVLDFEKLEYISSAGLRVLLSAQKVMSRQGSMRLIHVNEAVMEIFEVTGFSDILTIQ